MKNAIIFMVRILKKKKIFHCCIISYILLGSICPNFKLNFVLKESLNKIFNFLLQWFCKRKYKNFKHYKTWANALKSTDLIYGRNIKTSKDCYKMNLLT